jgi:hypothetical protein
LNRRRCSAAASKDQLSVRARHVRRRR